MNVLERSAAGVIELALKLIQKQWKLVNLEEDAVPQEY